jgi:hypothetical protein
VVKNTPLSKKAFLNKKRAKTCTTTQSCGTHYVVIAKIVKKSKRYNSLKINNLEKPTTKK